MKKNKYRVLLVDDSPDDRFFIRTVLERGTNFSVVAEARDGQEAVDLLQKENGARLSYDILFLDLKMPGKNGFDVLQWVQSHPLEKLTMVVMSGSWLPDDISKSMSLGAHGYFKKTSDKKEQETMVHEIEQLLRKRSSARL